MSQKVLFAIDRMSVRNERQKSKFISSAFSHRRMTFSFFFFLIVCDNRSMQNWHVIVQAYPAKINPINRSTCGDVEKREIGKSYITFIPIIISKFVLNVKINVLSMNFNFNILDTRNKSLRLFVTMEMR